MNKWSLRSYRVQLALSVVLPLCGFLAMLVILQVAPFGDKTFLYDDMKRQYVDYYSYYKNILLSKDDFFYSFSSGLGSEMFSSAAYYLLSPLLLPFVFLQRAALPAAITILIGAKLCLCSLSAFVCLREHDDSDSPFALALAFAYAFSSYNALNATNIMWLDVIALFPLLLAATRWMLEEKRHATRYFVLLLCLSLITNFYITYMVLGYLLLYVLLNAGSLRKIGRFLGRCVLSAAATAFVMLPTFLSLLNSGKNTSRYGEPNPRPNILLRDVVSKMLAFSTDSDQIFLGNPHIYAGILILFGVTMFFLNRQIEKGRRLRTGILLGLLTISFMYDPLNRIWHAFAEPEGYLYRFSFLFIYTAIECTWVCVAHKDGLTWNRFVLGCGILAAFLMPVFTHRYYYLDHSKKQFNVMLLVTEGVILAMILLLRKNAGKERLQRLARILALVLVMLEMADVLSSFSYLCAYANYGMHTASWFQNKTAADGAMIAEIEAQDHGFYRIENEQPRSENDAFQYGTNGVNVYSSVTSKSEREFMQRLGYNDNRFFVTYTTDNMAAADAIFGVKYMLQGDHWTKLQATLPMIYANAQSAEALRDASDRAALSDDPFSFAEAILGTYAGHPVTFMEPATILEVQQKECAEDSSKTELTFQLEAKTDGSLYFYLQKLNHIEAMTLTVNGQSKGMFGNASCTNVINLGNFSQGEQIRVDIANIEQLPPMEDFLFESENVDALQEVCAAIPQGEVAVEKKSSSHLVLSTGGAAQDAGAIVLAIPYETNWDVLVDGRKVEPVELFDIYMAIPLPAGGQPHTIDLRYWPLGFRAGTAITVCTVMLGLWVFWRRNHETRRIVTKNA